MKPKARGTPNDLLQALLDEMLAEEPGPRAEGARSLRARLVSRLYFAGFQVIEEIGTVGERTVPFVLGVKGHARASERAVLVAATLRPALWAQGRRSNRPVPEGTLQSALLPTGVAGVACALAAMGRLRESELNRPLVFLVAFDEAERGSALVPVRERYGLDVATALLLHPTAGGVALASPGLVALEVGLRRCVPEWRVGSLERTLRLSAKGARAVPDLLEALSGLVRAGGAVFEPNLVRDGAEAVATALVAAPEGWEVPPSVVAAPAAPDRLGYPLGPELAAAHEAWVRLRDAFPEVAATGLNVEGDALRLALQAPLAPDVDLATTDLALECAIAGLEPPPGLELEVSPRLHRPPFLASARVREVLAATIPDLAPQVSVVPSEAGFAGTSEVLLIGPEEVGQGATLPRARAEVVTDRMVRLLVRLLG